MVFIVVGYYWYELVLGLVGLRVARQVELGHINYVYFCLHMAQLMPLPLTISCSSKSILVLPFWCQLTRVVPDKIQEGRRTVVCLFGRTLSL